MLHELRETALSGSFYNFSCDIWEFSTNEIFFKKVASSKNGIWLIKQYLAIDDSHLPNIGNIKL